MPTATAVVHPRMRLGQQLYDALERAELPDEAVLASLGCGNPIAVAELREGETVLDLGSGGGIDVLLSAKRVGPTGKAYGVDMTEEMLRLARRRRGPGRGDERRIPGGSDRGGAAARRQHRRGDLQLRGQPFHGQARRAPRDVPAAATRRTDRHQRRRRRGSPRAKRSRRNEARSSVASPARFRSPSTSWDCGRPGSPTLRSPPRTS